MYQALVVLGVLLLALTLENVNQKMNIIIWLDLAYKEV